MSVSHQHPRDGEIEREHYEGFHAGLAEFAEHASHLWRWGDGNGGYVLEKLREAIAEQNPWVLPPVRDVEVKSRPKIPKSLRTAVYERDDYACVVCGSRKNLSLDHVHPYSLGGTDTFDNLQAMCKSHNSSKGARV